MQTLTIPVDGSCSVTTTTNNVGSVNKNQPRNIARVLQKNQSLLSIHLRSLPCLGAYILESSKKNAKQASKVSSKIYRY